MLELNSTIKPKENCTRKKNLEYIFKQHNGEMLAKDLSKATGKHYRFLRGNTNDKLCFVCKTGDLIILNEHGDIIKASEELPPALERTCQLRLAKTNKMFQQLDI